MITESKPDLGSPTSMGVALRMNIRNGHGKLSSQRPGNIQLKQSRARSVFRTHQAASCRGGHKTRVSAVGTINAEAIHG